MSGETVYTPPTVDPVAPKQSRPSMILRTFRVAEDLWERAKERGEREGVNLSDVIRDALEKYADGDKRD